ncbi:hypothetical protein ABW19_dt0201748 [Dactylella cylindrospora]|nr:hypothetical protein ABW19_dt0201748 [Dactylella cylindrospora]
MELTNEDDILDQDTKAHRVFDGSASPDPSTISDRESLMDVTETVFVLDSDGSDSGSSCSDGNDRDDVIFEGIRPRKPPARTRGPKKQRRSTAVKTDNEYFNHLKVNGLILKPQYNVQLRYGSVVSDGPPLEDGYFMRIKRIFRRRETYKSGLEMTQDWIKGLLFRRHRELGGILPKTAGEVALVRENAEVRAGDAISLRNIILTNQLGRDKCRISYQDAKDDVNGRLICRWKARIKYNFDGKSGVQQLGATGYIRRLTEAEADLEYRVGDKDLSAAWRAIPKDETDEKTFKPDKHAWRDLFNVIDLGDEDTNVIPTSRQTSPSVGSPTRNLNSGGPRNTPVIIIPDNDEDSPNLGSSGSPTLEPCTQRPRTDGMPNTMGLTAKDTNEQRSKSKRRYTFGDAFCGAGGATCGARMAGFKIRWGVDHKEEAIKAWRSNFGRSLGYHEDVYEFFARNPRSKTYVDFLHLSPPCQFFSWARTVAGKDDEKNEASFFVVPNALNHCRPRAVTVEETDGLIGLSRTADYFRTLLGDFTMMGYSVKYAVLNAAQYGVPSRRKRLVLIACCPGETLADFPKPTHFYSPNPLDPIPVGLKPAVTLRQALGKIPAFATDHNVEILETIAPSSLRLPPHEWDEPFRSTIKCAGGEYNLHPDRNRKFTLRELATLQSFHWGHLFYGNRGDRMRQIGNAFPPKLVGAVMTSVRKHLEKTDEEWEGGGIL